MSTKLSKEKWFDHGLITIKDKGYSALKANMMVKDLGVSRGSFYWHFENIDDYHQGLLTYWYQRATLNIIDQLDPQKNDDARNNLMLLIQVSFESDRTLEWAMRNWTFENKMVHAFVEKVDQRRIDFIEQLLLQMGLSKTKAKWKARMIYVMNLGFVMSGDQAHFGLTQKHVKTCTDLILA